MTRDMIIGFLISALLVVILVLGLLLYFSLHTIHLMTNLHFRELVTTRHQWAKVSTEQRSEIQALTESYLRDQGKAFIPPIGLGTIDPAHVPPTPSSFRFRPNPPFIRIVNGGTK